jgi:hypothetical protein
MRPRPRTSVTKGSSRSASLRRSPELAHAGVQRRVGEDVERGVGAAATSGPPANGRAVVAGLEHLAQALAGDQRADRQAAAERLGGGQRVGDDAGLLVGPQRAGAREADLDLVEDERGAVRVARLAAARSASVGDRVHARLALDRLEQDGGGAVVDGAGDRVGGRRDGDEAGHERRERRLLALLRRGRQRAVGAAVEAALATTISPPRLALRASLSAASTASAPLLVKKTPPPSELIARRSARRDIGSVK